MAPILLIKQQVREYIYTISSSSYFFLVVAAVVEAILLWRNMQATKCDKLIMRARLMKCICRFHEFVIINDFR